MGRQRPVGRDDRPVVRLDAGVVAAEGEHRLDGQAQAGLELAARAAGPVVGDLRLLVHLGPDAVADELADDPEARRFAATASTAAEMSSMWLPGHGRRDAGHHRARGSGR